MNWGHEHKEIACPNCGSKMKTTLTLETAINEIIIIPIMTSYK